MASAKRHDLVGNSSRFERAAVERIAQFGRFAARMTGSPPDGPFLQKLQEAGIAALWDSNDAPGPGGLD